MTISEKRDPRLWARAKAKACTEARLCKHSARKMQWATRYYKHHGGTYVGPKSSENSLTIWGRQDWRTLDGKRSEGRRRYLPSKAWKKLTSSEKRRTNAAKLKGFQQGRQYVKQPADIAIKTRRYAQKGKALRTRPKRTIKRYQKSTRKKTPARKTLGQSKRPQRRPRRATGKTAHTKTTKRTRRN